MKGLPDGAHAVRQPFHLNSPRVFAQLTVERLVDERIHGLSHADYACKHDAPCVGAIESAGGGDGDGTEQDGSGEGTISATSPDARVVAVEISIWFSLV